MEQKRYLTTPICEDLEEKMVFLGGPRQVGKTTLTKNIVAKKFSSTAYYNWDNRSDKQDILNGRWKDSELVILDELHKYSKWKNLIKGEYDKHKDRHKFLITGSARLNVYRRGGDSLMGRYHYYRLHPYSVSELSTNSVKVRPFEPLHFTTHQKKEPVDILYQFGGFPEPHNKQTERHLRRWQNDRLERLFREDIRDASNVQDLDRIELLAGLLPARIGSLFSLNSVRETLDASHKGVSNWIKTLESFYYHFPIYPYHSQKIRSLKKEPKIYLWDWTEVVEPGSRFENMIASHLLKLVHFLKDVEGYNTELRFIRDESKREVDFVVLVEDKEKKVKPWFAVEVKLNDKDIAKPLHYFKEKLNIPIAYQVLKSHNTDFTKDGVRVISAAKFLTGLP